MQCPNCGAEIGPDKFCQYCGSQITYDMRRAQELINKTGCPRCGSSGVSFKREKQGEIKSQTGTHALWHTIGCCKDCGYTWEPEGTRPGTTQAPPKRRTWLWVLGWIFIFPVPLTILMLRNRSLPAALRYGIIAAAWIVYLMIGMTGKSNDEASRTAAGAQAAAEISDILVTRTLTP